mmetsp:Transcript_23004/g.47770  ORF Transcript_23004/g.47770 Transcript_23004/m.47770 type:complete len:272 (+) Transcript_23004:115-930(+)
MFDDIDLDELDADDAVKAGDGLESSEWNVRRDACKALGELSAADKAQPFMARLKELALSDPDYEVKKAARKAMQLLREQGVQPPAASSSPSAGEAGSSGAGQSAYTGPQILLKIFKEELPMRIERDMTPNELTEFWEKSWGVQYASRIKFEAPEGSPSKWLNPREDLVPRSPAVVPLWAGVGSITLALATALKQYGMIREEDMGAERERRRQQQLAEAERRQEADAKEQERWRKSEMRRQQRQMDGGEQAAPLNLPFVKKKVLGGQTVAGL